MEISQIIVRIGSKGAVINPPVMIALEVGGAACTIYGTSLIVMAKMRTDPESFSSVYYP